MSFPGAPTSSRRPVSRAAAVSRAILICGSPGSLAASPKNSAGQHSRRISGCFFSKSRLDGAALQNGQDIFKSNAARFEQYQQVIKQIGCFRTQRFVALANARDNGLDRFLAELLGATLRPGQQELARVGFLRGFGTAGADRLRQPEKNIGAHGEEPQSISGSKSRGSSREMRNRKTQGHGPRRTATLHRNKSAVAAAQFGPSAAAALDVTAQPPGMPIRRIRI